MDMETYSSNANEFVVAIKEVMKRHPELLNANDVGALLKIDDEEFIKELHRIELLHSRQGGPLRRRGKN